MCRQTNVSFFTFLMKKWQNIWWFHRKDVTLPPKNSQNEYSVLLLVVAGLKIPIIVRSVPRTCKKYRDTTRRPVVLATGLLPFSTIK